MIRDWNFFYAGFIILSNTMLPHNHFLISGGAIAATTIIIFPENSTLLLIQWILVGGLISAAIDLDIVSLVYIKARHDDQIKPFKNPVNLFRRFKEFMDLVTRNGLLKTGMVTHLFLSLIVISAFYFLLNSYFIPVVIGVVAHILSDIPNVYKVTR